MEIGEEIYIKVEKIYGEEKYFYKKGTVIKKYPNYVLVEFKFKSKTSYKESFNLIGLEYKKELGENDYIL